MKKFNEISTNVADSEIPQIIFIHKQISQNLITGNLLQVGSEVTGCHSSSPFLFRFFETFSLWSVNNSENVRRPLMHNMTLVSLTPNSVYSVTFTLVKFTEKTMIVNHLILFVAKSTTSSMETSVSYISLRRISTSQQISQNLLAIFSLLFLIRTSRTRILRSWQLVGSKVSGTGLVNSATYKFDFFIHIDWRHNE